MHGVGTETVRAVFAAAGFTDVTAGAAAGAARPGLPHRLLPESRGARRARSRAGPGPRACGADIVLANDPDADRCAVAVPLGDPTASGGCCAATRSACCSATRCCASGIRGTYATTIVSSSMLGALAADARRRLRRDADRLQVDRPGRTRSRLRLRRGAGLRGRARSRARQGRRQRGAARGRSWPPELKADGSSLLVPAGRTRRRATAATPPTRSPSGSTTSSIIADTMRRLRGRATGALLGQPLTVEDLLPDADVLRWRWPGGRVVVRGVGHRTEAQGLPRGGRTERLGRRGGDDPAPAARRGVGAARLAGRGSAPPRRHTSHGTFQSP